MTLKSLRGRGVARNVIYYPYMRPSIDTPHYEPIADVQVPVLLGFAINIDDQSSAQRTFWAFAPQATEKLLTVIQWE